MSERDELAELIATTKYKNLRPAWAERDELSPVKYFSLKQADAILAAGYRKMGPIASSGWVSEDEAAEWFQTRLEDDADAHRKGES